MSDDQNALVIFVDVRGFTRWSESNEVFVNLNDFVLGFLDILRSRFKAPDWQMKPLGDGALLLMEIKGVLKPRDTAKLLARVLQQVDKVNEEFGAHCTAFAQAVGHAAQLRLGWGIVRGKVMRVGTDWAGHNLNKGARLCSEARPYGVLIDKDDFPQLPAGHQRFVPQVRRLLDIGEVRVWATPEIASKFVPREQIREQPEVHIAGTCVTEDSRGSLRVLIARRSLERRLYPGKFEGCGGQLRYSESFTDGVRRHFRLELGIDVEVFSDLHAFYEIREPNEPLIPGIRFLCRRVGDVDPTSANHSELRWVTEREFRNMPAEEFVGSLKREVLSLIDQFKEQRRKS